VVVGANIALGHALANAAMSGSSRCRILANLYSPSGDASCLWWARDKATRTWQAPLTSSFDGFVGRFVSRLGDTSSETLLPDMKARQASNGQSFDATSVSIFCFAVHFDRRSIR
jgi:hypothetical protein